MKLGTSTEHRVHILINAERRKRKLHPLYWSIACADYANTSVDACAKLGELRHARLLYWNGGENLAFSNGNFKPKAIVKSWMNSEKGHRENLLNLNARKGGVAIKITGKGTYVAWTYSMDSPSHPDCPGYRVNGFWKKISKWFK